jgi:hypothetical protein
MDVAEDFLYSDFDVFVSDSTKENQNIEAMKTLLQPAMQNGASLLDAAAILTSNNMSLLKEKLGEIEEKRDKMMQAQQQAEQQAVQQKMELDAQIRQEENRIKEEASIRQSDTAIQVALIGAGASGQEEDRSPELDAMNNEFFEKQKIDIQKQKLDIDQQKVTADNRLSERAQAEAERKNRVAEAQKAQEIVLKRKVANKPTPRPVTKK